LHLYSHGRVINALEGVYLLSSCLHLLSSEEKKYLGEEKKLPSRQLNRDPIIRSGLSETFLMMCRSTSGLSLLV
jgi:hypothetical protein